LQRSSPVSQGLVSLPETSVMAMIGVVRG